ncbi:hypothetical protein LY76DRAFT_597267 [Colletotrichum caudatum]|nr:hypothetical protein LY76DRAFT_597267 [Colletotrichum caudatum]
MAILKWPEMEPALHDTAGIQTGVNMRRGKAKRGWVKRLPNSKRPGYLRRGDSGAWSADVIPRRVCSSPPHATTPRGPPGQIIASDHRIPGSDPPSPIAPSRDISLVWLKAAPQARAGCRLGPPPRTFSVQDKEITWTDGWREGNERNNSRPGKRTSWAGYANPRREGSSPPYCAASRLRASLFHHSSQQPCKARDRLGCTSWHRTRHTPNPSGGQHCVQD